MPPLAEWKGGLHERRPAARRRSRRSRNAEACLVSTDYLPFVSAGAPRTVQRGTRWQRVALWFVICWFFFGGLAHFALTDLEARIVPPQIPDPRDVVLLTGFLELAGAFGLMLPWTRRAAGWGLFLLTIAVTPANIYMIRIHDQFDIPVWLLWLRLPLQLVLLWLVVWGSRWRAARRGY
jgi:uncharacterized membrane protein